MSFITADWIREGSTSTGTGAFTLSGALSKGFAFSSVCLNNDTCEYSISHNDLNEIETGFGTFTTGNVLQRTIVYTSTNGNALVNFSAGNKTVELINSAKRISSTGTAGNTIASGATVIPLSDGDIFSLSASTNGITGFQFNVERPGRLAWIKFLTARVLTHSATLNLPTAANITTAVGDYMPLVFRGGTQYDVLAYFRANGQPLALPDVTANVTSASTTAQGKVELADSTETNTGTDTTRAVTPAGLAAWTGKNTITTVGTLSSGNATAIVDTATEALAGKIELSTQAETNTGTDDTRAITPVKLVVSRMNEGVLEFSDDFYGSGVTGGDLEPWIETSSAAGTNLIQAGGVNHPGVFRMVTGATSGNNKRLHIGSTASDPIITPTNVQRFKWIVRIPTITTIVVRIGLMQDVSATSGGTAGAYFEFDPTASGNWRYVTRQASSSTANNALAVTANNWYTLEAIRLSGGNWEFYANGTLRFTHSATLPTTDCNFGVLVQTATAAARNVDLDFACIRGLFGQRFT